jgi:hypothetical protein
MPDLVWDIRFSGSALIAGETLSVAVFLQRGELAVVALDGIPRITVSVLFDQFFGPQLSWPRDIFDLSLDNSSIFYSYVEGAKFPATLPPSILASRAQVSGAGLFVATTISLTLAGYAFPSMVAHVSAIKGKGFTIEGDLTQPVALLDADFLLLSGSEFQGGPSLSVQSFDQPGGASRRFALSCAYTLFGHRFGDSTLTVSTDSGGKPPKLSAQLGYKGTLGPFKDPELDFTWAKDEGFRIQKFPRIPIPDVVLDFKRLLQQISSKKGCGQMVDLAFKEAIQTGFFVTPTMSTTKPAGSIAPNGQVYVLVNGYYKISALGTLVATIDLPQLVLSFSAPKEFSFDGIVGKIGQTIVDNGEAVLEQLWDDRAQLAKCLAAFVAKEVIQKLIGNLICDALKQLLNEFMAALGEAALDTIGGSVAAAAGAAGAVGGKKCGKSGGDSGGGGGGGGGQSSAALAQPVITQKMYRSGAVALGWNGVGRAVGYEVQLADSTRRLVGPVQRLAAGARSASLPFDPLTVATGACLIQLKALADAHSDATDSAYATTPILKLGAATNVSISCDSAGEIVTAVWDAVSFATQYALTVRHAATGIIALATTLTPPPGGASQSLTHSFPASQFATRAPGDYVLSVRALAGENAIDGDAVDAAAPLPMLAPPSSVTQQVLEDRLRVTWSSLTGKAGYQAVVTNVDTSVEALRVLVMGPDAGMVTDTGTARVFEHDLSFADFTVKTAGRHRAAIALRGDAAHIGSAATESPEADVLFAGVGFTRVGTDFTVS